MTINRIIVSSAAKDHLRTQSIISHFPEASVIIEDNPGKAGFFEGLDKRSLFLDSYKGSFLKPCPCSSGVLTCGYYVLSPVMGCPFGCSYCILDEYLNAPGIKVFVNLDDMFAELDEFLGKTLHKKYRIGTGELADSLALEPMLGIAEALIEFFQDRDNAVLELKTKSVNVDFLTGLGGHQNIAIGFSVGPEVVSSLEEPGTPGLKERLEAATRVTTIGYKVAFHFDPIIDLDPAAPSETSASLYCEVADMIYDHVPKSSIAWISLGALRFGRTHYLALREQNPGGLLMHGEFIPGFDNKMRYLRHRRRKLFTSIIRTLRDRDPETPVYLCMEDKAMVEKVLGSARLPF